MIRYCPARAFCKCFPLLIATLARIWRINTAVEYVFSHLLFFAVRYILQSRLCRFGTQSDIIVRAIKSTGIPSAKCIRIKIRFASGGIMHWCFQKLSYSLYPELDLKGSHLRDERSALSRLKLPKV